MSPEVSNPNDAMEYLRKLLRETGDLMLDEKPFYRTKELLQNGYARLERDGRLDEYPAVVANLGEQLLQQFARRLRDRPLPPGTVGLPPPSPRMVGTRTLEASLKSICPLWPFC
jgi:hypothetical protein